MKGRSLERRAAGLLQNGWRDGLASLLIWTAAMAVVAAFGWIISDLVWRGLSGLSWRFVSSSPLQAGRSGGILPMVVSSLTVLTICLAVAVPISIATAVWLTEFSPVRGRFTWLIDRCLDLLAAIPSIVFGLFGNALFCVWLGLGYSLLAGGLTLACMVLPMMIRSTQTGLRAVPDSYRHAAISLGMSRSRTAWAILLPAAAPGIAVAVVLAVGRTLAETAALLFTSGYVDRMPVSVFDSGRTLSIHVYDLAMNVPGGERNAYSTAMVLIGLLLAINLVTVMLGEYWAAGRLKYE